MMVPEVNVQFSKVADPPFSITMRLANVQFLKVMLAPAGITSLSLLSCSLRLRTSQVEPAAKVSEWPVCLMLPSSRTASRSPSKKFFFQPTSRLVLVGTVALPVAIQEVLILMVTASLTL